MTSGNPIGRRETFEAYRLADPEGMGVFRPHVFQADVAWIMECFAAVRMVHGNMGVRDGVVLRDIHGPCDCIDGAVEEAIRLRDLYRIDVDSSMSIEVVVSLLPTAVLPDTATRASFGRTTHRLVPSDWRRGGAADAEKALAFVQGTETMDNDPRSPPIILTHHILSTVAWTSAVDEESNAESIRSARAELAAAIRDIDPATLRSSWETHDP